MKKTVIYIILSGWMFAGCGTYSRYHRPDLSTENLYRDVPADIDTTTIASLSWREMFTDPKLQSLIETGLERNTDLNVARLRVEATEAVLMTARLSYLPSLGLTAEGNANKHDGATAKTYNVGASASWGTGHLRQTYGGKAWRSRRITRKPCLPAGRTDTACRHYCRQLLHPCHA